MCGANLNDQFRQVVGRRGLAAEEDGPRRHRQTRIGPQAIVEDDHMQNVEQLPLVFVDTLDLAIEETIRIYCVAGRILEPLAEGRLGFLLGFEEARAEVRIVGIGNQLFQTSHVRNPTFADGLGDEARQPRVGQHQPAARRDAVGLVAESLREHLGEIRHELGAQQVGVDLGDAVGAVAADDGEVSHAHLAARALLDETHALQLFGLLGETLAYFVEKTSIDLVDNGQMTRQQHLKEIDGPFLQSFGQQSMVRVGQGTYG
jgi:hypothetical protein